MWSSRSAFARFAVLGIALGLAACGFRPLHGDGGGSIRTDLSDIEIAPVADRVGQMFRNHLLETIHPEGQPSAPRYRLVTGLTERVQRVGFQKNEFATRANLLLAANYTVISLSTREELFSGSHSVAASYNILSQQYATLISEADARGRAAQALADEVALRLSIFFADLQAETAPGAAP